MKLPNEIIGGGLVLLSVSIVLFIRYIIIWRADMQKTKIRLVQIEEEILRHPKTCSARLQMEDTTSPPLILTEKSNPDSMEMIRHYIHIHFPTFLNKLTLHINEKLTPSEELLCMMIKLKYSNKEIGSILSITTNSVITARYRLKKKLSLSQEMQLDTWIQTIEQDYTY